MSLPNRTVLIDLEEYAPGVRRIDFRPKTVAVGDNQVLLKKRYPALTNASGVGSRVLPCKTSGYIDWIAEIPGEDGETEEFEFSLAYGDGSDIYLSTLIAAGSQVTNTLTDYVDANAVLYSEAQSLTEAEKLQARTNIGATAGSGSSVDSVNGQTGAVVIDTGDVAENGNLYFTSARVLAVVLTGISFAANTAVLATDTVLQAFGKLQAQIAALIASVSTKEDSIAAGTTSQYWRGDKSWQTLDKTAVGLSNADNTSDANKPVSTAQQTALDAKAAKASNLSDLTDFSAARTNLGVNTTANQSDSSNKRFVTDAQLVVIGNTSGTNTGDETLASIQSKLVSTSNLTEGSNLYFTTARVLATALTGLAAGANAAIAATDTILQAFAKAQAQIDAKQATLVSGTNIKTINGSSILGSGDLVVSGSGSSTTVVAKTADYTILTGDAEKTFTNEGAGAAVVFTLPTAAQNLSFKFICQNLNTVTITAGAGDTIRVLDDVTAAAGSIAASQAGACLRLTAINATEWIVERAMGDWSLS